MEIQTNLSDMAREIDVMGKAVFKDIGDSLAQGIWEEFVILLNETAQYSGSTAASWNLSMRGDRSVRMQGDGERLPKEQQLAKGHQAAVQIAKAHNFKSLIDITELYAKGAAIMVENHAPGASRAETGPLRPVNNPTGAFERFKMRVAFKTFKTIRDRQL